MRLISLYLLIGVFSSLCRGAVSAATVLAPGESKVIGGEEVVCSTGKPSSKLAKLYISCSSSTGYPFYTLVAENGSLSRIKVRDPYDEMCTATMPALKARTTAISRPVEIAVCGFGGGAVVLNNYLLYPAGNMIFVRQLLLATSEDCVKEANMFNATP